MGLYKRCLAGSLIALVVYAPLIAGSTGTLLDRNDFLSRANKASTAMIPAPLPRVEFARVTATLYPAIYRPHTDGNLRILPSVGLQWWVSPNLSILGGLGSGITNRNILQFGRIGFRYLPESFILGRWTPEITLTRNRIEGLPDYGLTWNEIGYAYRTQWGPMKAAGAVVLTFQRIFPRSDSKAPDVPGKLEATSRLLILSIGYNLLPWLVCSAQAKLNPDFITAGAQLSLAI